MQPTPANLSFEQLALLVNALPDPVFILTRSGCYAGILGGTDLRYYHDGSALVGKQLHEVLVQEKADWFCQQIAQALAQQQLHIVEYGLGGRDVKGLEDGPDGRIWFEGRVQALPFLVAGEEAVLWVASNITERHELETRLRHNCDTDELTGLYNRRRLMQALNEHFADFQRSAIPCSLLLFDIDHFKHINDDYGHQQGDQALQLAATLCRQQLRPADICARLGGDEFVVLMGNTPPDLAMAVAERVRIQLAKGLNAQLSLGQGGSISGGLTAFGSGDSCSETVLKRADDALYEAKRTGRNRIVRADAPEKRQIR